MCICSICISCIYLLILLKSGYWEFTEQLTWWGINMRCFHFSPISVFKIALSNFLPISLVKIRMYFKYWNFSLDYNFEPKFRYAITWARLYWFESQEPYLLVQYRTVRPVFTHGTKAKVIGVTSQLKLLEAIASAFSNLFLSLPAGCWVLKGLGDIEVTIWKNTSF